jgi:DIS3-like exonuclease 2
MSSTGATAPPPGLSREPVPTGNTAATPSAEARNENNSKPRSQQPPRHHRRGPRNHPKPKTETNVEPSATGESEASGSKSRKPRIRKPRNSISTTPPPPNENNGGEAPSSRKNRRQKNQSSKDTPSTITSTPQSTANNRNTPATSRSNRSSFGGPRNQRTRTPTPGKPIFKEHSSLDALVAGLENGSLFRAKLRCNPGDRSQGFCTISGLPHDVFIPDWKPQNRAIEGDEVAIQILPLSEWRDPKAPRETRGGNDDKNRRKSRGRGRESTATPSRSTTTGNILPFGSVGSARNGGKSVATTATTTAVAGGNGIDIDYEEKEVTSRMPISTPITPATIEITLGGESQCIADQEDDSDGEEEVVSELVAAPALVASPSGGELPISLDHSPLGLGGVDDEMEEEEEEHDVSMVGFVTEKLQQANLQDNLTTATTSPAATVAAPLSFKDERPWQDAASPAQAIAIISELLNNDFQGWRATAEVVGIMKKSERRDTIVGVLKMFGGGNSSYCLIPRDPRLPRCLLEPGTLKRIGKKTGILNTTLQQEAKQEDVPYRTLLAAHITSWDACNRHPNVEITRIVGKAGGLDVEIEALLTQERIHDDDQFTPEVLSCLPAVPWKISDADVAERRDLRSLRIFSIDPPTARDLDDALSIEELPNGMFQIGVHIADVSHFVTPATALDEEAAVRSTSVYLVDRVIPMLPRLLCEELCSLNPGVDRLAFSIIWEMDCKGNIQNTWAGRTIICSCGKLSYPQVQELIDGTATPEGSLPEGVQLHGDVHSWTDVAQDALKLHSMASEMRRRRFEVDGALRLDNVRLYFQLDDEGKAVEYGVYQQKEANRLVEEFMLAANMTAAKIISSAFPDRALLRRHMPPNTTKLQDLATTVAKLLPSAPRLDVSSAGTLQKSLLALRNAVGAEVAEVVTLMCTKPMQTAQYFCTGDFIEDPSLWRHYALAVGHYTHFTSPIRRYPDVLVHRLLQAALDKEKVENEEKMKQKKEKSSLLFNGDKVAEISAHANERKTAAKAAQDGALKLYLASLLLDRPGVFKAVVIGLGGSRFFDAYVPALGIDVRVHTDRILKGGDAALNLNWNDETKFLKIDLAAAAGAEAAAACVPCYDEVENLDKLHNPESIEKIQWPLELRPLCSVPVVVCGARSKSSGSPAGVHAKIFV